MESRTWLVIWRASIVCVTSSRRSARVDLPWSMCAMIEKFRNRDWGMATRRECTGSHPSHRRSRRGGIALRRAHLVQDAVGATLEEERVTDDRTSGCRAETPGGSMSARRPVDPGAIRTMEGTHERRRTG